MTAAARSIELLLTNPAASGDLRHGEPVTMGVPLPRGFADTTRNWAIEADGQHPRPVQARVLDRWADGSIRWALVDFQADSAPSATTRLRLVLDTAGGSGAQALSIHQGGTFLAIDTGAAQFRLSDAAPFLFEDVSVGMRPVLDGATSRLRAIVGGEPCVVRWHPPTVEERGALRASVRAEGELQQRGGTRLQLTLRLHFYAGSGTVRTLLTVRNPRRAAHPGGIWELGDAGSVLLDELSLVLRRPPTSSRSGNIRFSRETGKPFQETSERVEVYQESSGGENWMSPNHVNRHGDVPLRWRGYRMETEARSEYGHRATPIAVIDGDGAALGAAIPQFWQNFPRALTATRDELVVAFFPAQSGDVHELQGGEQKTHECFLLFGEDAVTRAPLDWSRSRVIVSASPEWYARAEAVRYLTPAAGDPHREYLELVNSAIEGPDTFADKRERIDEYGWRHFGDIYGDHEAVFHGGPPALVSHYNNQYDAIAGFALQFMHTGDVRWWTPCVELAAHVVDIDMYHTDADKSAYNHGLFWHTVHYTDAGKSTHRTYPRVQGSNGGGPASEHNYTTGLMLHHFMTGEQASRDAALELAQFVIDMDDGDKTPFAWLVAGDTGRASASRTPLYHGPGRGSGNSLNALVDGHRLSGERRFLDKAEQIIRRSTHPRQAIEPLGLLDRENRWFYTMFLQSLGKYLDHKIELGQLDEMYAYGQATLLHYARWMAANEYPYLDKPEELEFPTETWAAQDVRKSDVFNHAARHARGAERERFLERAEFFFRQSMATLQASPTRRLARPVVLLLSHGFMRADDRQLGEAPLPAADGEFGERGLFIPQKLRAKRRAVALACASAGLGLAALASVVMRILR